MYAVDEEECTGCGACLERCPAGAISMQGRVARIDQPTCNECGSCAEVCPQGAIYEYEVEELPTVRAGERATLLSGAPEPILAVARKTVMLTRQEKVTAMATLVPLLSRLVVKLASRVFARSFPGGRAALRDGSGRMDTGKANRERHRWRGGS